eukprot:TRINITY_DN1510_c0_g3_i1.p1 TRINITY_DN1510_c0_g3~~TRINITY_DN1510_c0_g3_i1.p1  ORF type:complete len:1457 (+),score=315.66 TRINITY_DN1510_c0_g3_i1:107-4372(+)
MRAALLLAAAALLGEGRAASRQWAPSANCPLVNLTTWARAACWSPPGPPPSADNDTVTFTSTTTAVMINTSSSNITVEVLVLPNLVISKGTTVALVQGSLELQGSAQVHGALQVVGAPNWGLAQGTSNEDALKVDTKARTLGLRDCAYTPVGFTPRLCGPGVWSVEDGGVLDLHGMYASVFSDVQVQKGGTYHIYSGAHPWGLIENWGNVTTQPPAQCTISAGDRELLSATGPADCQISGGCWDPPGDACAEASQAGCGFSSTAGAHQCAAAGCCHRPAKCSEAGNWTWAAPCGPDGEASKESCLARGCCWNASTGEPKAYNCTYDYGAPICRAAKRPACFRPKDSGLIYWHGIIDNKAGGVFFQGGTMYFDEYTHDEGSAPVPEKFNQESFRNAGHMSITGRLWSTKYYYHFGNFSDVRGTYYPSFTNAAGATMLISGHLDTTDPIVNHGTWEHNGEMPKSGSLTNTGVFNLRGSLFTGPVTNTASGTMTVSGYLRASGAVVSHGTWMHTHSGTLQGSESLLNTGTFNLSGGVGTGSIVNSGVFSSGGSLTGTSFVNNGSVTVTGSLHLSGGDCKVNNSGNWTSRGNTHQDGPVINTGRVIADAGSWSLQDMANYNYLHAPHCSFQTLHNIGQAQIIPSEAHLYNNGSILMLASGVNRQGGGVDNYLGARLLFAKGGGTWMNWLKTSGDVVADGHALWISHLICINCHIYISGGAELHVQNAQHQGRAPQVLLADLPPSRGTPKVCTAGVCAEDPCPYTVSPFSKPSMNVSGPCTFKGEKGPLPGVMAYGACYACVPTTRRGLLGDKGVIERLIREGRRRVGRGGGDGPAPDADELSYRRHHFEGGTVRSDGTGSLILTGSVHLFGRKALRVHNTRVHTVLEWGHPALLGGGTLTLRQRSVLRLGVNAVLDEGGSIHAGPGTAVVVDSHASVSARNHSLQIAPKASVRVDGQLHVGARSTLRSCGTSVGSGGVTFDDPASSAVTCAAPSTAPAQCLSDCRTDADCSAAGSCTWCSKAHGGAAAVGSCTEPRAACKSAADCSYQGDCIAGLCANCHKYGLTHTGPDCSKLVVDSPAALLDNWRDVATGKAYSGDVVGAERIHQYSLFLATHKPNVCPNLGGPDDMIVNDAPAYSWDGNMKVYPGLLLKQAQLLTPMLSDASQPNVRVFFDYSWPRTDGCSFNYSQCIGTCPGGGQCGFTSAADCGCPAQCAPRGSSAAQCGTRIAVSSTMGSLGDCGPHDSCFCGRDGEQKVIGSKGCPSSPRAVQPDKNNNTVLLFYHVGDGKNIGLAEGGMDGPWRVIKEPIFPADTDAVQDPFVYRDHYGWHMLLSGVAQKNIRAAFSEDGKSWTLLPKPLIDLKTEANGPLFTQVSRPRVYTEGQWSYQWDHKLTYNGRCYKVFIDGKTSDKAAVRPYWWQVCSDSR